MTQDSAFDVVILGGGPAGSAAALSLMQVDSGLRVLLAEATAYDAPPIGETLAPGGQALLQGLGCWERFRAEAFVESYGTAARWGAPDIHHNEFLLSARGNGWHLDRARFDAMLAACASDAGVTVMRATRYVSAERHASSWRLLLRTGTCTLAVDARFVIDATGRSARFATGQGARQRRQDRLVGASMVYRQTGPDARPDSTTLVEAEKDGWWYSAPLPDSRLLVAWMSDADLIHAARLRDADAWRDHLARTALTGARVGSGSAEAAPRLWPAATQHLTMMQGDGWAAAGDAACAWDPLSSAGILKALRTGRLAAFVTLDALSRRPDTSRRYARLVQREHAAYLEGRTWFYSQETRWQDAPFWRRRAAPTKPDTRPADAEGGPLDHPGGAMVTAGTGQAPASGIALATGGHG